MPDESASFALTGESSRIARLQSAAGRLALTPAQRDELAAVHDRVTRSAASTEDTVLWLLTYPFRRDRPVPEYYRYTNLHVYRWFLDEQGGDQATAAILALDTTLTALTVVERRELARTAEPAAYLTERYNRLMKLRAILPGLPAGDRSDSSAGSVLATAEREPGTRRRRQILAACTGFPMSPEHSEHLFLRAVQSCELAFFLIRYTAAQCIAALPGDPAGAAATLDRLARYAELPNDVFLVLETLSPELFMTFRVATGAASAVQSLNYHLMESVVYGHDRRRVTALSEAEHLRLLWTPQMLREPTLRQSVLATGDAGLVARLERVERSLLIWRGRHFGFGRRYLPGVKGSGGTAGASYLKQFVVKDAPAPQHSWRAPSPTMFAFHC